MWILDFRINPPLKLSHPVLSIVPSKVEQVGRIKDRRINYFMLRIVFFVLSISCLRVILTSDEGDRICE